MCGLWRWSRLNKNHKKNVYHWEIMGGANEHIAYTHVADWILGILIFLDIFIWLFACIYKCSVTNLIAGFICFVNAWTKPWCDTSCLAFKFILIEKKIFEWKANVEKTLIWMEKNKKKSYLYLKIKLKILFLCSCFVWEAQLDFIQYITFHYDLRDVRCRKFNYNLQSFL